MPTTVTEPYDVLADDVQKIRRRIQKCLEPGEERELKFDIVDRQTKERRSVTFYVRKVMRQPGLKIVCTGRLLLSNKPSTLTIYEKYGTALFEE